MTSNLYLREMFFKYFNDLPMYLFRNMHNSVRVTSLDLLDLKMLYEMKNIMDSPEHRLHNTMIQQQCLQSLQLQPSIMTEKT